VTGATAFQKTAASGKIHLDSRQEFLSLYPNRIQSIFRPEDSKTWVTVDSHWRLSDEQIDEAISLRTDGRLVGCRWGSETRIAVFDIDADSKYHNAQDLKALIEKAANVALNVIPYRSSDSAGWHLYIPFDQSVSSHDVQKTLRDWLVAEGFQIKNGTLEIFPSGNGLRLPLQAGFAWLDASGQEIISREDLTTDEAISRFLADLRTRASNWSDAKELIKSQLSARDRSAGGAGDARRKAIDLAGFDDFFRSRMNPKRYQEGRRFWEEGLSENGQRHDAVCAVEHYLWYGDPSADIPSLAGAQNDKTRIELIKAWLEKKHNGFCRHIRRGKLRKVHAQITRACLWRPRTEFRAIESYPMTERLIERLVALYKATGRIWSIEDLKKGNDGRLAEARDKIRTAVELLSKQGRRVGLRQLMRLTGCHQDTVNKHADLWKSRVFSSVPGDKNPVLGQDLDTRGGAPGAVAGKEFFDLVAVEPPLVLPGKQPTSEPPASNPSPSGAFGSFDTGTQVHRFSGRGSARAGGSDSFSFVQGKHVTAPLIALGDAQNENIRAFEAGARPQSTPKIKGGDAHNLNIWRVLVLGARSLSCLTLSVRPYFVRTAWSRSSVSQRLRLANSSPRGPPRCLGITKVGD